MSDAPFSPAARPASTRAGYRLHYVELFNWGTFDSRVWRLHLDGDTSLLTGDIGSGKSTVVDALTTLLLPANRITYNKAAGADSRERTLRSYVEGHYKSERSESTGQSRAIGLRDHRSYSVVLGVFVNESFDETVTIAQVFHQKDRAGQPDRFFVTSGKRLSIEADFTDFGSNLAELRRRLRAAGADISNGYPEYSRQMRTLLGIRSEQALDLFHQTVSMKSVGNLTEFVRSHMLEPADASDKVKAIVGHFEDLAKSHAAVRRAKDQLDALNPLVATADLYDTALAERSDLERQREAVRSYFAELRIDLLTGEIANRETELDDRRRAVERADADRRELSSARDRLIAERATAGGDELRQLEVARKEARRAEGERRERRGRFASQIAAAGFEPVEDTAAFDDLPGRVKAERARLTEAGHRHDAQLTELATRRKELDEHSADIRTELESLALRRNNLPLSHLDIRAQLCRDLRLDEGALSFAGELIDVADGHGRWRGAAERVLRGFALSLLVPHDHYPDVARWTNERRLTSVGRGGGRHGMRLVYERVPHRHVRTRPVAGVNGLQLAQTLDVAPGPFEAYLRDQLARRADHLCAETLAEFRAAERAVTEQGQIRSGDRHEKDDRSRVDDPRTWVLGWANERKVEALTAQLVTYQQEFVGVEEALTELDVERAAAEARRSALAALDHYTAWRDLDWAEAQARAVEADEQHRRLLAGSTRLAEIERQLHANDGAAATVRDRLEELRHGISILEDRNTQAGRTRTEDVGFLDGRPPEALAAAREVYDSLTERLGERRPATSDGCAPVAAEMTAEYQSGLDSLGKALERHGKSLLNAMNGVRNRWPEATTEMDADAESRHEFRAFRDRVADDDLPAFENEFKRQLNTNTIRELAGFSSWLRRQADDIGARVDRINEALGVVPFNDGRYITLVAERTVNQEVQAFRAELRAVTDDALDADDDRYSEQRFLQVQQIIERFRGREKHAETDRAWTARVTDVRNWFTFAASERSLDTHEEWEHYSDSDGKSGGQKEKLAYTILAASLAYQFGLEWGAETARDFRFAVIDEAFGRGSDLSTRFALELFATLGLQLLIVTPLQKVHIIEPYVRAIGFVDNPTRKYSRLHTLTIEEFQERRASGQAR